MSALDVTTIKRDFPILEREVNGKRLVYLDSASSAQKPVAVLDAMDDGYRHHYANIHRGVYTIAEEATAAFEAARRKVARFVNAPARTRSSSPATRPSRSTSSRTRGRANLKPGDVVVLSHMEHHANVVPWHILAAERGIELRWIPMTPDFRLDLSNLDALLDGARLLAISAMSNVLGTINDIRPLADAAHAHGALILVDACQYVPHVATDVQAWDADFVAFSSHKMLRPHRDRRAVGAHRAARRDAAVPRRRRDDPRRPPRRLHHQRRARGSSRRERPAIVEAVGFGAAIDYISAIGMDAVRAHERLITRYALESLRDRFGDSLTIYGPTDVDVRGGAVSFLFDGIHAHDISQVLDEDAVCVRAGHHCAKPLMRQLGVPATTRASFYVYNDEADVDALVEALAKAQKFFAV